MTDPELTAKKLARIETSVQERRTLGDPSRLRSDVREQRFTEHTLQVAIQSALDMASHIVSDDRLGEPGSYRESSWSAPGIIPADLARELEKMAGFRGYDDVDLEIVRDIVERRLDGLLLFVERIRERLP